LQILSVGVSGNKRCAEVEFYEMPSDSLANTVATYGFVSDGTNLYSTGCQANLGPEAPVVSMIGLDHFGVRSCSSTKTSLNDGNRITLGRSVPTTPAAPPDVSDNLQQLASDLRPFLACAAKSGHVYIPGHSRADADGCVDAASLSTGTVTSVGSGTGLTGGPIVTSGTLSVDVGTTADKIVQLDGLGGLPAVDGRQLTNLDASRITSGTVDTARLPLASASSTGALSAADWNAFNNRLTTTMSPAIYTSPGAYLWTVPPGCTRARVVCLGAGGGGGGRGRRRWGCGRCRFGWRRLFLRLLFDGQGRGWRSAGGKQCERGGLGPTRGQRRLVERHVQGKNISD
jgi:hypothetical protein